MNPAVDPAQLPLRDIHLPVPVGWWPPAPGWWILAGLALAAVGLALLIWQRGRIRRAALRQLREVAVALRAGTAPTRCVQQAARILRRYSMTVAADPRAVAGLTGEAWLAYLDSRWGRRAFMQGAGRSLLRLPYAAGAAATEAQTLTELCIAWVREQREPARGDSPCGS